MNLAGLDKTIFLFINSFVGRFSLFDNLIKLVVNEYFVPVTLALILLYLWFSSRKKGSKNQKYVLAAIISVGLVDLIIELINNFFIRQRPFFELRTNLLFYKPTDPSFPSNAATVSFAIAYAIFLANKKIGGLALALAGFYAFSRVYAGVHYPSDVLAGAALGVVCTYFISRFDKHLKALVRLARRAQESLNLEG